MTNAAKKFIAYSFNGLFFLMPLVLYPYTSEVFEFNKMLVTYIATVAIVGLWVIRMISEKRLIFRRTILDIPLLIFLATQLLSTVVSFDIRTSFLGYYSRFNGGLLSSISYSLLYWALVSNLSRSKAIKSVKVLFASALLVSIYAILERLGVDKDIWVQDVQHRVFSTLGQPNWLAAWLVSLIPVTWSLYIKYKDNSSREGKVHISNNPWIYFSLGSIFFISLIFTKSRSGILGFAAAEAVFWGMLAIVLLKDRVKLTIIAKNFLTIHIPILITIMLFGTPWTPTIKRVITKIETPPPPPKQNYRAPTLETSITPSEDIRVIVWKGAIDVFKAYPILGTGVETFAYSYYQFRPASHNMVTEWDFLYNKAHNEYLNYAATTGALGLASYLILIAFTLYIFIKYFFHIFKKGRHSKKEKPLQVGNNRLWHLGLLSGYFSILVTNFFGFSVVPVAVNFFIFPALTVAIVKNVPSKSDNEKGLTSSSQKTAAGFIAVIAIYLLVSISRYWIADIHYAKGELLNDAGQYVQAMQELEKATSMSPNEAIYWDEISTSSAGIAVSLHEAGREDLAGQLASKAKAESDKAISLSPANINILRNRASVLISISPINANYLLEARNALEKAVEKAPTEAKLVLNLGLLYARTGDYEKALEILQKAVELKPDYRQARYALGILYNELGEKDKALNELQYILDKLNPEDEQVKEEIDNIENATPSAQ
jgi:putative inorganic carbon (HCO3(-)) transporter